MRLLLNNYRIKTKLSIVYVICVLIPMIVTDSIVYNTINNNEKLKQQKEIEYVIDRVKYNLNRVIDDSESVSNYLYGDSELNELVSDEYQNPIEFYERYNNLLKNKPVNYCYTSKNIYEINIYADNSTLINGKNIGKITPKIREKSWYKQFCENDQKTTVTVDFENDKRTISIVRKFDNIKDNKEKLIKIDLDYKNILNNILKENVDKNLYVTNDNLILFSNTDSNMISDEFQNIAKMQTKSVVIEEPFKFKDAKEKWNIIVSADDIKLMEKLSIKRVILLMIFNLGLPTLIIWLVSSSLQKRVILLNNYLGKVENEEFTLIKCNEGKDEIGSLIKSYNLMVSRIKQLIEVVFREDAEKKALLLAKNQAELRALQSQVNPHFMFNTLESIRMRSLIKGETETAEIIEKLAILLRKTINWGDDYIPIEEEILFAENYLKIQKYRFGDKLSFNFDIMEDCLKIRIPKLTIVTFVENSCVHGIEEVSHNANVHISIFIEDEKLIIKISDTGKGIPMERLRDIRERIKHNQMEMFDSGKRIGMLNAYMRLKMYFNDKLNFEIYSEVGKGTDIKISILKKDEKGCKE